MTTDVVGFATSHGPMLSTPPTEWTQRAAVDHANHELEFEGRTFDYASLLAHRSERDDFASACTADEMQRRYDRCQAALDRLADAWREARVDRAVIIGNDHKEIFSDECFGALTVYAGSSVMQIPFTEEAIEQMAPGTEVARDGHTPRAPVSHPTDAAFADELIAWLNQAGYDVARSTLLPLGKYQNRSMPHAFGFVYRRIMRDRVVPHVPVFVNTFYPPNQPLPARCVELGRELGRAIAADDATGRTAVIASGGLTHFVIDEELDAQVLTALRDDDLDTLAKLDPDLLRSGTSEIRNWIVLAGAMHELGLRMDTSEYVPCYRTEAGTGNAMAFVTWR